MVLEGTVGLYWRPPHTFMYLLTDRVLDGVLDEALGGVEALFGAVVFHRDVKPDTILIGKDGRGVLVDF